MKFGLTIYGPFEGNPTKEYGFLWTIATVIESNEDQRNALWKAMEDFSGFDRIEVAANDYREVFFAVYHYSDPASDGLGCVYRGYVYEDGTIASLPLGVK